MCGIAGILRLEGDEPIARYEIDHLTDAVSRRGPDGRGTWLSADGRVALGHRRLSILDLSENGKQPMSFADGRFWITFNGEVYNFLEIREKLEKKGYTFHSDSDTEVILASYQEWGEGMLDRFNGMWALGIYDTKTEELFLSRDRFGIKPLYYYRDEQQFLFSSEVQALHQVLGKDHPVNALVLQDVASGSFLNHGTEQTYLQGVRALPGGYNLKITRGVIRIAEWYTLKRVSVPLDFEQQVKALRSLLRDSVILRLRSDVSIGTCLSGGVDSGGILGIIDKEITDRGERSQNYAHRSFCASFPGTFIDESEKARFLAETFHSKLDVVPINPPSVIELEEAMQQCDGPMHSLAFFPIWKLYQHIKEQKVTVTLDGQGPDEMLGGYRPIYEALMAAVELKKPHWFFDIFRTYAALGESRHFSSKMYTWKVLGVVLLRPIIFFGTKCLRAIGFPQYENDLDQLVKKKHGSLPLVKQSKNFHNSLDKSLFVQFFQNPLPGILNQYDRCSMSNGVECRMPYMDYRVVEFIFSLPPESKVGHGYTKRVLREALRGIVPDKILLDKEKIGFNAPIVDWFHGSLKDFMRQQMSAQSFLDSPYFDGKKIRDQFEGFLNSGQLDWNTAWRFWGSVHVAWWLRQNVDESVTPF